MQKQEIISIVAENIENQFKNEASGHDWWHIYRVWQMARKIGEIEDANLFVLELAALLHDIADWKFHDGDEKAGGKKAEIILRKFEVDEYTIEAVRTIIDSVSYKGANVNIPMESIEGKIVQDADRLDAIGAIGIARTFAYGGSKGRTMYDPIINPVMHSTFEEYKSSTAPTINHFFEKLLLLKDRMNTKTGKQMAQKRHQFMETYLNQFFIEWNGEL